MNSSGYGALPCSSFSRHGCASDSSPEAHPRNPLSKPQSNGLSDSKLRPSLRLRGTLRLCATLPVLYFTCGYQNNHTGCTISIDVITYLSRAENTASSELSNGRHSQHGNQ